MTSKGVRNTVTRTGASVSGRVPCWAARHPGATAAARAAARVLANLLANLRRRLTVAPAAECGPAVDAVELYIPAYLPMRRSLAKRAVPLPLDWPYRTFCRPASSNPQTWSAISPLCSPTGRERWLPFKLYVKKNTTASRTAPSSPCQSRATSMTIPTIPTQILPTGRPSPSCA